MRALPKRRPWSMPPPPWARPTMYWKKRKMMPIITTYIKISLHQGGV